MAKQSKRTQRTSARKVETKGKKSTLEKYDAVVSNAELGDLFLQSSEFEMRPDYYSARNLTDSKEGHAINLSVEFSADDIFFDSEDGVVGGNFIWILRAKVGRKQLLKLKCVYVCFYTGLEGKNEGAAIAFLKRVGRFATYPYFRTFTSQISWCSGADLPILPLMKEGKTRARSE